MPVLLPGLLASPPSGTSGGFPDEDLELTVRAAFGADLAADSNTWEFTDLSDRVLDTPITVQRGVVVGGRSSRTASASVTLLNSDCWLTPHHPASPWWPYVDAGTPIAVSVRTCTAPLFTDTFTRTVSSGWGTSDSGTAWSAATASFAVTPTGGATITATAANQFFHTRTPFPHRDVDVTVDVTVSEAATGAALVAGLSLQGSSGGTNFVFPELEFGTSGNIDLTLRTVQAGVFTGLAQITVPGLTYTAGTVIKWRTVLLGDRIRMRAWLAAGVEPSGWTVDYTLDLADLTLPGTHLGLLAWPVSGNTNGTVVFGYDNLTVAQPRYPRIEGYIADIQPSFEPASDGTVHSTAILTIGGVGTVLDLRDADPWSPMRRSIQWANTQPVAYWPLEDGERATQAASGLTGQPAMQVTGPAVFSFDTGEPEDSLISRYGSKNLCSLAAGARLSTVFAASPVQTAWTVGITAQVTAAAVPTTEIRVMEWATAGTFQRWALVSTATGHAVRAYNDIGLTVTTVCSSVEGINTLIGVDVQAVQNGPNIDVKLVIDAAVYASGSVAGTLGTVTRVDVNPDRANTTGSTNPFGIRWLAGHVVVHDSATASSLPYYYDGPTLYRGDRGWYQEPSHLRAARLCREARVPFRQLGGTEIPTPLNAQQEGSTVDLVTAAVEAQSGALLIEDGFGYALVDRSARYHLTVALTIDLADYRRTGGTDPADVLQPVLALRSPTVWTVERTGGSQATWAASPAYRARRGEIAQKATLDLLADTDTLPHAQWRVHLVEDAQDAQYPGAPIDLTANPELIDDWLALQVGARMQRVNQPTIAGVGVIDQVVEGMTETIGRRSWMAAVDAAPYRPWRVAVFDDPGSRLDSASTTLASGLSAAATTVMLTTANPREVWATAGGYDLQVGGEVITVPPGGMSVASGTGPYTQTVTGAVRSVNGISKSHTAGASVRLADPVFIGL